MREVDCINTYAMALAQFNWIACTDYFINNEGYKGRGINYE